MRIRFQRGNRFQQPPQLAGGTSMINANDEPARCDYLDPIAGVGIVVSQANQLDRHEPILVTASFVVAGQIWLLKFASPTVERRHGHLALRAEILDGHSTDGLVTQQRPPEQFFLNRPI